jgi:DNA-binding MarR family transcriptional regulator
MKRSGRRGAIVPRQTIGDLVCACASARLAARTLTQLYDRSLRGAGVEAPQFALLMTLDALGPCSQAALGHRHALDKTTISRNLRLLERNGWAARIPGRDRRERRFALTPAGRERLAAARPAWRRAQQQLRAAMTTKEWDAMFGVFRSIERATSRAARRAGRA